MIDGVINPIQSATQMPTRIGGGSPNEEARGRAEHSAASDAVELSTAGQEALERDNAQPIRLNLVERVRAEIADGSYLTDAKLDAVVNRLHSEFFHAA